MVSLISDEGGKTDKALLSAATGAIWKCAQSIDNVRRLDELEIISILVDLLRDENEEV